MKVDREIYKIRRELCSKQNCETDFWNPCALCPNGHWKSWNCKQPKGLGDIIEIVAKPIAKALHLSCLDEQGKLKPQSPCAKRRDKLNKLWQTTENHDET